MVGKRKRYSAEFKAKVAIEALRGELTTSQLASKHGVHQTMVGDWKRQAVEGLVAVFSGKEPVARLPAWCDRVACGDVRHRPTHLR